jgi:hypothetical protein
VKKKSPKVITAMEALDLGHEMANGWLTAAVKCEDGVVMNNQLAVLRAAATQVLSSLLANSIVQHNWTKEQIGTELGQMLNAVLSLAKEHEAEIRKDTGRGERHYPGKLQ